MTEQTRGTATPGRRAPLRTILAQALCLSLALSPCLGAEPPARQAAERIAPLVVTEAAVHDTDDPAIWINPEDPAGSLITGTDKKRDGALMVYDLAGRIDHERTVPGLLRPSNVDDELG